MLLKKEDENSEGVITGYFSIAVVEYPDRKQLRGERVYSGLQLQSRYSPPW